MLFDIKKNLEKIALSLSNETKANENMLHAYFDYLETVSYTHLRAHET